MIETWEVSGVQSYTKSVLRRDFKWEDHGRKSVFALIRNLKTQIS